MPIRRTPTRQWVLRTVKFASAPLTAPEVLAVARRHCPDMNRATVYRNLEFLAKRGEVYEFEGEDGTKRYVGHAYHQATFRCQRCGQVRHLKSKTLPAYVDRKMFGDQTVFISKLSAQGLCASCARKLRRHD